MHLSGDEESRYLKGSKHLVWQLVPYMYIYLTQMDKEIHCKKERNLDILFHCTTAIQSSLDIAHSTQGWRERELCNDGFGHDPRINSHCYRGWQFAGRNPPTDRPPRRSSSSRRQSISVHA